MKMSFAYNNSVIINLWCYLVSDILEQVTLCHTLSKLGWDACFRFLKLYFFCRVFMSQFVKMFDLYKES